MVPVPRMLTDASHSRCHYTMLVCLFFRLMFKNVPFHNLDSDSRPTVCSMNFHVHVQK